MCHKFGSLFNPCSSDTYLKYANTCPLTPAITQIPSFLPDWMSTLTPIIENLTLLDLTLPGTHDSLTYDLSLTISDGGIDDHDDISKILHMFSDSVVPSVIEDFIRQQATTQKLTITQQLDNGVRFVDFRQMQVRKATEEEHVHAPHILSLTLASLACRSLTNRGTPSTACSPKTSR